MLSLCRAAQQSRWPVHVPPAASASSPTSRLHVCPSCALRSSQPAEEDHADSVSDRPGQPGGRHELKHRPGTAPQQLGAQQQHPPGDQVNANDFSLWLHLQNHLSSNGFFLYRQNGFRVALKLNMENMAVVSCHWKPSNENLFKKSHLHRM